MFLKNRNKNGFTLVEMIVSLAIVTIIMSVILFNYSSFTDNLALSAAAQELAITIRQAQTYGLSVKEVVPSFGNFSAAYGVYLNATAGANTDYTLFADTDGDKYYDSSNETIQQNTFRDGVTVSNIVDANSLSKNAVNITFLRPIPDARIYFNDASNSTSGIITLKSARGKTITITVQSTGQVSVGQPH